MTYKMSEQMTSAVAAERTGSESTVLVQLLYLGSSTNLETEKYGRGLDVNMKLFTHTLNEQSCQIALFLFP